MNVVLRIEDKRSMIDLVNKLKGARLLGEINVPLNDLEFPVDIPLDVEKLLELVSNPVVGKIFGKKMETTFTANLVRILETA